jgi:hypothetical protein
LHVATQSERSRNLILKALHAVRVTIYSRHERVFRKLCVNVNVTFWPWHLNSYEPQYIIATKDTFSVGDFFVGLCYLRRLTDFWPI